MTKIIYDQNYELCSIDVQSFLEESLGEPLTLPDSLRDLLDRNWICDVQRELYAHFSSLTGSEYEQVDRNNVYNLENDFENFFIYTIFAPVGTRDWAWAQDCFVAIEIGGPGDPRYTDYGSALIYRVSETLGDSGFFSWNLGWLVSPISKKDSPEIFEKVSETLSQGYSCCPTSEILNLVFSPPIWSEKRHGYVARLLGHPRPVLLTPYHFCA